MFFMASWERRRIEDKLHEKYAGQIGEDRFRLMEPETYLLLVLGTF